MTVEDELRRLSHLEVPPRPTMATLEDRVRRRRRQRSAFASVFLVAALLAVVVAVVAVDEGDDDMHSVAAGPDALGPGSWGAVASAPLERRMLQSAVWTGDEMLVWGGRGPGAEAFADGAAYDPTNDRWRPLSPGPLSPRESTASVWTGREMIVFGGNTGEHGDGPESVLLDGAAYDPATDAWRVIAQSPLETGYRAASAWTGEEMLVWGGTTHPLGHTAQVAFGAAYNPATDAWRLLPEAPIGPRHTPAHTWTGAEFVIWGGTAPNPGSPGPAEGGAAYDPTTDRWRVLPDAPVGSTAGATATWTGSEVVIVGGTPTPAEPTASTTAIAYDPATNRWRRLPPMPEPWFRGTSVWTGREVVLWGGASPPLGTGYRDDGFAYDPALDRWRRVPEAPVSGREFHTATWTGHQMLVWGGFDAAPTGDGAAYSPGYGSDGT